MLLNLKNPLQSIFITLHQWRTNRPKEAPGPSWLDETETQAKKKRASLLEYLCFDSPRLMRQYGSIIRLAKKHYFIADPEAFKHILRTHPSHFSKNNPSYRRMQSIFGKSLIVSEGLSWEKKRTLLQPVFDRQSLSVYSNLMTEYTTTLLNTWEQNPPTSLDITRTMGRLTLQIAFKAFGHFEASIKETDTVINVFDRGNPHVSFFPLLKPWIPTLNNLLFFRSVRKLNKLLKKIIEKHNLEKSFLNASTNTPKNALDILLDAKKTVPLNDSEILDEFKLLLITGHETTACGLSWAFYLLAKNPEYRTLLEEELASVLKGRLPTLDDCPNLPITKAIFLETLRLYPSIWWLPRIAKQTDEIGGYTIPAQSYLMLNLYALHRNPKYWENPETFYPPRFLGDAESKRHPFSYLPFSIGPHSCIGSHFAIMEGILVLATIGQRYRLEIVKDKEYKPEPNVSLRLPSSIRMQVQLIERHLKLKKSNVDVS